MKTLNKTMVDFVFYIGNRKEHTSYEKDLAEIYNYANFLSQPLKLEMFVAVDDDGNVFEEPKENEFLSSLKPHERETYQKALEKVIFEGFQINNGLSISDEHCIFHPFWNYDGIWKVSKGIKTIEDLIPFNLTLKKEIL